MKKNLIIKMPIIGLIVVITSCETYLSVKPDQSLAIPTHLADLQAMLDFETNMNRSYPDAGDIASDYYYLEDADWEARPQAVREVYHWYPLAEYHQWNQNYSRINYTNIVLDLVDDASTGGLKEANRHEIKGSALFYRGFTMLSLANLYAPPYEANNNHNKLGIPLRLEADINIPTTRSTLEETYSQIVLDFKSAAALLPVTTLSPTRPSKVAAYAALARVYLIMGDYPQALFYADSCLVYKSELIDYNTLDPEANLPFSEFNEESVFYALLNGSSGVFNQSRAKVKNEIYALYEDNDLRRITFFVQNSDGSYAFKGSYAGRSPTSPYAGLAIDEVYLIAAECATRLGETEKAARFLDNLLVNRYVAGTYDSRSYSEDPEELLERILLERKKELIFRGGVYWSDLRRLNKEPQFAEELTRRISGTEYTLGPNDVRYTFLIPIDVIQLSGIPQNKR